MSGLKVKETPDNGFGVIMKTSGNKIRQIGLTESEYSLFEAFLGMLSKEKQLIMLPEEYNLVLEREIIGKEKQNSPCSGTDIHK